MLVGGLDRRTRWRHMSEDHTIPAAGPRRPGQVPGPQPLLQPGSRAVRRRRPRRIVRARRRRRPSRVWWTKPAGRWPTAPSSPSPSPRSEPAMSSRHPPVTDWATDFDHTDPAWVADPYPDLGRPARPGARSPTANATAGPGCRCATRTSRPSPTTPSTSPPVGRRQRDPARARAAAGADRSWRRRSPRIRRSTPWPGGCCCRPSRPNPSPPWSRSPAICAGELLDATAGPDRVRRRRRVRPAHPAAGDHRHARLSPGGRRHFPPVHPSRCSRTSTCRAEERQAVLVGRRDRRLHGRPHRRAPGRAPRRPDLLSARGRDSTVRSCRPNTCAAPWSC